MDKPNLTIIDGSSLIYSACYNTSVKEDLTDDFSKYKEALLFYITSILEATKADKYVIFGDQSSSYRKRLFPVFKADRSKQPPMKFRNDLTYYAINELGFINHPDLESDDMCLLTHSSLMSEYNIIIASKDSDLRQYPATFFDYGIFKEIAKGTKTLEEGFETIDLGNAYLNFWKLVLTKGHNNKSDYLEGCGDVSAKQYLLNNSQREYQDAVLSAFINGINKGDGIRKDIPGYGLYEGIDKFQKSFVQSYLFRNLYELPKDIVWEIPTLNDSLIQKSHDPEPTF